MQPPTAARREAPPQPHPGLALSLKRTQVEAPKPCGFDRRQELDEAHPVALGQVIAAARRGQREAVRHLYLRYKDNVYGYVCSIVRDEHEAEDVTQQVFAKLVPALQRYQPRAVPFSAWILRVARNLALDHIRRRRAVPVQEVRDPQAGAEDHCLPGSSALTAALSTLPEDQRRVLMMRHLVGLSPAEIAQQLGKTEPSVHGLHHRGRRALRSELERLGAAPATQLSAVA